MREVTHRLLYVSGLLPSAAVHGTRASPQGATHLRGRLVDVMAGRELEQVREIALALPEVNERLSHGAPCFFVRDERPICRFHDAEFAGDERMSLWCPAPQGVREDLVAAEPERFFAPAPSASGVFRDWIAVYLDTRAGLAVDWHEIAAIIEDAYRLRAPKSLVADLDG
jgi:hypothetical protein